MKTIMGLYFIWISLSLGIMFIIFSLQDIKIESRRRNQLLEEQNEILKNLKNK